MKSEKVSAKYLWPLLVSLILLVAGTIVASINFISIGKQADVLYNDIFVVKTAANKINETFEAIQIFDIQAVSNDSKATATDEFIIDAENSMKIMQEQSALVKQNLSMGDTVIFSRVEKYLSELDSMQESFLRLIKQNKRNAALEYMRSSNMPVIKEAQKELVQFIQSVDVKEAELMASLQQTRRNIIPLLVSLGVACVLFSMGIIAYLWKLKRMYFK